MLIGILYCVFFLIGMIAVYRGNFQRIHDHIYLFFVFGLMPILGVVYIFQLLRRGYSYESRRTAK